MLWIAQSTTIAALLAGLVWVAVRVLRPSPTVQHALWLLIFIKLVMPPAMLNAPVPEAWARSISGWSSAFTSEWRAESTHVVASNQLPDAFATFEAIDIRDASPPYLISTESADSGEIADNTTGDQVEPAGISSWSSAQLVLLIVWFCGSVTVGVIQAVRIARLSTMLKCARPTRLSLQQQVAALASTMEIRPPRVVTIDQLDSPLVWACFRPTLAWPGHLNETLTAASRQAVLVHELAHLRRRDHWVGWLELLASVAWWWNPLFWFVRRQLRDSAELACDAWVVATLPAARREYAEALIEVSQRLRTKAVPTPAMGLGRGARHIVARRLTMILRDSVPNRMTWTALVVIGMLAAVAVPAWTVGQEAQTPLAVPVPDAAPQEAVYEIQAISPPPTAVPGLPVAAPAVVAPTPIAPPALPSAPAVAAAPAVPAAPAQPPAPAIPSVAASGGGLRIAGQPQAVNNLQQLKALQEQIARLQVEISTLQQQYAGARLTVTSPVPPPTVAVPRNNLNVNVASPAWTLAYIPGTGGNGATVDVETLSRGTYKLPSGKAEAIAAFLGEHLGEQVDVKVKDDALIVTTTPEIQSSITHFVALFTKDSERPIKAQTSYAPRQSRRQTSKPEPAPSPESP